MATLREQLLRNNSIVPAESTQDMGQFRRGLRGALIGTELNTALADESSARAAGDLAQAGTLRQRAELLQSQQGMAPVRVGRVEDIGGVGDALDYAAGQVGSGLGSMAAPVAAGVTAGGVGGALQLVPHGGVRAAGRALQKYGTFAAPAAVSAEQLKGEFYGNAREDETLMATKSAEEINRMGNIAGAAGGALDAVVPGLVARGLTGAGIRAGLARTGAGTRILGQMGLEGATETGQGEIGRSLRGVLNPEQDTTGFTSDRLNEFVGGAIGSGPINAADVLADDGFRRVGTAAEAGAARTGEVIDLASGAVTEGVKRGKEKVVDLREALKERSGAARSTWEARQEEIDLLNLTPQGIDPNDMDAMAAWMREADPRRTALVRERLSTMGDDPQAQDILSRMDDPAQADDAVEQGAQLVMSKSRLDNTVRAAARFVGEKAAPLGGMARSAGRSAMSMGKAAWEGLNEGRKLSRQGAVEETAPVAAYLQAQVQTRRSVLKRNTRAVGQLLGRLGSELESMARAGVKADDNTMLHLDHMAQHLAGAFDKGAVKVAQELQRMLPGDLTTALMDRVNSALAPTNDTLALRRAAADRLLAVLPSETEKRLLRQGINLRSDEGKRQLLGMVEALAMGRVPPAARAELARIVGDDAVTDMIQAIAPAPEATEATETDVQSADARNTGLTLDEDGNVVDSAERAPDDEDANDSSAAYEQRQGEKKLARGGGAKYYGFGRKPKPVNSKESRDPFAYTDRATRRRPELLRADQTLSSGENAIENKVASMQRYLAGQNVDVSARTASEVLDSLGAQPAKRLQLFVDYMMQEGAAIGGETGEKMMALGRTARNVLLDEIQGAMVGKGAVAGTKDSRTRSTAGDRAKVRKAMQRYFDNRYLVVGESMSDVDPERIERADFDKMVSTGKTIMAQREAKDDMNGHAHRNNILFFEDAEGNSLPIKADDLSRWAQTARRAGEMDAASGTRAWVQDLMTGISALMESGLATALPTKLRADGEVESFADGIPRSLVLPSGKAYGDMLDARRRNPRSIKSEGSVEEEQAQDDFFVFDDTALPERSDQDEFEGVRIRTREQGMEAANLPRGARAPAREVAATPGKSRAAPSGEHESRVSSIADNFVANTKFAPLMAKGKEALAAAITKGVPRADVFEGEAFKPVWAEINRLSKEGEDTSFVVHRLAMMADQIYGMNPSSQTVMKARTRVFESVNGEEAKLSSFMDDILADESMSPVHKVIAKAVSKVAGDTRVFGDLRLAVGGAYSALKNDIRVALTGALDPASTVMHEGVHAATVRAMEQDPELTRATYALMAHVVREDPSLQKAYGLTSTLEFMAEGMTNTGLQERLAKIKPNSAVAKYLGETVGNAWDSFVGLVRKALGLSADADSALMQLFELTGRAMKARAQLPNTSATADVVNHMNMAVVPSSVVRETIRRIDAVKADEVATAVINQYTERLEERLKPGDGPVFSHRDSLELEMLTHMLESHDGLITGDVATHYIREAGKAMRLHQYPATLNVPSAASSSWGGGRKLNAQSSRIHNDLERGGFAATHDSPHRFDGKFNWRANKFKGEGAMVFGAGTYLSTGDKVHSFYKKSFTAKVAADQSMFHVYFGDDLVTVEHDQEYGWGTLYHAPPAQEAIALELAEGVTPAEAVKNALGRAYDLVKRSAEELVDFFDVSEIEGTGELSRALLAYKPIDFQIPPAAARIMNIERWNRMVARAEEKAAGIKAIDPSTIQVVRRGPFGVGTSPTYQVSVQIMPAQLLNWNKPFDQQSSLTKRVLNKAISELGIEDSVERRANIHGHVKEFRTSVGDMTGEQLYKAIATKLGGMEMASDWLQDNGVLGHVYAASSGQNEVTPNYVIYDDSKIVTNYVHFNQQSGAAKASTAQEQQDAKDYIAKVLGPAVKVAFKDITGYAGEWIEANNVIEISTTAGPGAMNVAYHEALHAFFSKFVKNDPAAFEVLRELADNPRVLRQLERLLAGDNAALAQLKDGEERLAYAYQFWAAGALELPYGKPRTLMGKIRKFFRHVLGRVTNSERAGAIFDALHSGKFSGPVTGAQAMQQALQQGMGTAKTLRKIDGVVQKAAALVLPAESIMSNSKSAAVREIGKLFYNNPGDTGSDGKPGYINARDQMARRYINEFSHIVEGMDEKDYKAINDYMASATDEASIPYAPHRKAVKDLRALLQRFREYMVDERGVNMGNLGPNYYPRVWSLDKLMADPSKFLQMMEAKYPGRDAMATHQALTQNLFGDAKYGRPTRQNGALAPFNVSSEERVLAWMKPEDAAPFLEDNLVGIMTRYFHEGARMAEYTARFNQDGSRLNALLGKASEELRAESEKMLRTGLLKDQAAADKWHARQMRDVQEATGAMEGSLGSDIGATWRSVNSWTIVYQNIRLLPLSLFASFVDPMGMIVRGAEFGEAFEAFKRGVTEVGRQWKDLFKSEPTERQADQWERLAQYVGVVDAGNFEAQLADMYSSVYMNPRAKAISQTFFKLNGMEAWNRGMRVGATKAAVKFIERHSKLPEQDSKRWLDELGLQPSDIVTDAEGNLLVSVQQIMAEKGVNKQEARQIAGRVHNAINRWVTGAILTPSAAQRPAWSSDPHYSMFFHLKQFTYSFHQTILKRAVSEGMHGNIAPLGALFWYIPVMIGSDIMKGMIQGGGELPAHMKGMDAAEWMLRGAERGGIMGLGTLGMDASQDLASIGGPAVEQVIDAFSDPLDRTAVRALPANPLYAEALR